ncbi:cation diffusion facilitator family transporter [Kushneria avicenniae]|uniref:Cation diffusion facilitator family transporter n=1 Tax=Kushneria avicenniae TaxID=402385 RepID=A0A1I1L8N5_9GAMM|nr:cation diffusion facilitator family transporter [Kushneria avicenniae]SFC65910.1 cation diffusion facilitator family transporter [Kushneria avicenniae]
MEARLEQQTLIRSIVATLCVSLLGIVFGLLSGSESILFDGMFSAIDSVMSALSLLVARLAVREASDRFQHGFWHLEPLVAALNGAILTLLCLYAFLNAVQGILKGGHALAFGPALGYALLVAAICLGMYRMERRVNARIDSVFIRIDAQSWLMAGLITLALIVAFALSLIIERTTWAVYTPYVDVVLLAVLTLCLLPVPIAIVVRAMKEILLIAPRGLDRQVHEVMAEVMQREGLRHYYSHVARTGRGHFIEIHIMTTPAFAAQQGVAALDDIRIQIGEALDIDPHHRWFTVCFTADERWM